MSCFIALYVVSKRNIPWWISSSFWLCLLHLFFVFVFLFFFILDLSCEVKYLVTMLRTKSWCDVCLVRNEPKHICFYISALLWLRHQPLTSLLISKWYRSHTIKVNNNNNDNNNNNTHNNNNNNNYVNIKNKVSTLLQLGPVIILTFHIK